MQDTIDIRFSKNELNSLAKTKGTCVTLEKKTRVVFLLPSQLADIKSGIRECLDSNLLKYDYETKAIIIGYEKIRILSKYGSICYGYSKIALRIEANLYLFKPAVGRILQGVVCKQSGRHIGCLVHKGFNVSIPLEDEYACGWDFAIGQDMKFTVIKLDLTSGPLPYILGQLYVDDADCGEVARGGGTRSSVVVVEEVDGSHEGGEGMVQGSPKGECGGWGSELSLPGEREGLGGAIVEDTGGSRSTLINQLLKTVELSIVERGKESPKKGKQKRVSLGPAERRGGGGKVSGRRGVAKKGHDSGSIIDQLLEMSRREVLGVETSPVSRKRKADASPATKRKVPRKATSEGEGNVHSATRGWNPLPTVVDTGGRAVKWSSGAE